jgi:hypothetical protein
MKTSRFSYLRPRHGELGWHCIVIVSKHGAIRMCIGGIMRGSVLWILEVLYHRMPIIPGIRALFKVWIQRKSTKWPTQGRANISFSYDTMWKRARRCLFFHHALSQGASACPVNRGTRATTTCLPAGRFDYYIIGRSVPRCIGARPVKLRSKGSRTNLFHRGLPVHYVEACPPHPETGTGSGGARAHEHDHGL